MRYRKSEKSSLIVTGRLIHLMRTVVFVTMLSVTLTKMEENLALLFDYTRWD